METGGADADGQMRLWPAWPEPSPRETALARIERREREVAVLRRSVSARAQLLVEYLAWRWRVPSDGGG
jgi:hypothetical protein